MSDPTPTQRVLMAVADAADKHGGKVMQQLPDGRYIAVIVIQPDEQEQQ